MPTPVEVVTVPPPPPAPVPDEDLDSKDILAREPTTQKVLVKHVLFGWAALAENYHGQLDPRAAKRSNAEAAKLARDTAATLRTDPTQIAALEKNVSEDPGGASDEPYEVGPDSPFVPEFKAMALRLHDGEVGIVRTTFGYHVIMRVAPAAPDPLQSADILARKPGTGPVDVVHVLISWQGKTKSTATRTKAEADELAKKTLARARKGEKMEALIKEVSEDQTDKGAMEVDTDSQLVAPFKELSLRLKLGEAGLVMSPYGWHVIKRVPPPPPDKLTSTAILARKQVTTSAKVKHILLGWTDRHADDDRGKTRSRADLEKLVKATVKKLEKGDAIEPLMAELSEDPGSASSGNSYDVTPEVGMVKPFLKLSLRLKVGEVGVVDTIFGIHIIKRVE